MFCYYLKSFFKASLFSSLFFLSVYFGFAQTPIFSPAMSITEFGSVESPASEGVSEIIDNDTSTKFLDLTHSDGMGFTVNLGGASEVASSISITTANDEEERDPQNYTVSGSNNGTDFTQITIGTIPCVSTRFHERTFTFSNTTSYMYYRINFTTRCGGSANSIQLSEVQLYSNTPSPTFNNDLVQSGYNTIMGVVFNEDGTKMFVWEKRGHVYVSNWNGSSYIKQNTPVLNISDEVGDWRDFGFASFCLDPDFETNGLVYMYYMVDREHLMNYGTPSYDPNDNDYNEASISRLTRYKLNIGSSPLTTDYSSRTVLLGESVSTGVPLTHESHAGGTVIFANDGTLLVSTGDNASYSSTDIGSASETYYQQAINDGIMRPEENVGAFRSQMITSLCGKVLRLDPTTGDGVSSNPHYEGANPRSPKSRMWTMGLRHPFRMSVQPESGSINPADGDPGTIFVADVGWGTWEDLQIFDKGGLNGGWPLYEGQTQLNSYYNSGATNPDEGNALFRDNCPQPTNFLDNADPALRRFVHDRPEVAWKHGGTNDARVPWFSGTTASDPRVGAAGSPATGIQFKGNTAIAGVYITGNGLGSSMTGRYLFTDYVRNWINIATLTDGTQNWISDISELKPQNFGAGIVHMMQNPLDGSVYYVNINTGELHKISFVGPTWINEPTDSIVECDGSSDPGGAFSAWLNSFSGTVSCGNAAVTNDSSGLSELCGATGSETVTFTLSDECGNDITKLATFTIEDNTDPTWTDEPTDMNVECDANSTAAFTTWLSNFSGTDTCGTAIVSNDSSGLSDTCGNTGNETITFTLTDNCGNDITKVATFTIEDNTDPTWTDEPTDMNVECDSNSTAAFTTWLSSFSGTDTCGTAIVSNDSSGLSDTCGNTGSETITFTLTDNCGNDITKDATFTIEDNTDPTWTDEPTDMNVECDSNSTAAFTTWLSSFSGTDTCGTAIVSNDSSGLSDTCGNTGNETITFTLTDNCGNDISKVATFTIEDNTDPTWTDEPSDYTFSCDGLADPADAFNTWLSSFSGEDTCGTAMVSNNNSGLSYDCDSVGTQAVTFTLTDLCGNDITKQVAFTVENTLSVETETLKKIKIYPNPTESMVTISGLKSEAIVVVYDILGKQVKNLLVQNNQKIYLDLPSGIYLVKVNVNGKSIIKKLIVK